ncbi:MAG: methyltransferase domain-containing protein [Micrococcaceae bacterium]|nr:methyltransferase domain-containing protein [Micrococcaceae bacterium]
MNAEDMWDERYNEADQIWSGNVNAAVADVVSDLEPGTALDIGSGEGADAIWLAQRGWQVIGLDISRVAVQRAAQAADAAGLSAGRAHFVVADVTNWQTEDTYQLVTATFLHSQGAFDRAGALHVARDLVAPGGYLLVISHAEFPPWAIARHQAEGHDHEHDATTPASELELLQLDSDQWNVELAELRSREATGPEGEQATLRDTVVLVRRRSE